ncbi:MAG: transposase [Elusimicrobia bacterium]|nr:transposase [Elusimicrobiota bacterium]
MGRPTRIQFPGACYHIILQGNNGQDIFLGNQDRRYFLSLLRAYKERFDLAVYAYCLMPSAVELLIETRRPNLSRAMQGFNTLYTKYFNQQHDTSGHVFQGRYKALLVDKESLLLDVTRYIHLGPARAGLKEKPWRYLWSSCPAYIEFGESDPLVDSEPVLRGLAKSRLKQSVRYLHYVRERLKRPEERLPTVRGLFVGTPAFAASVGGQARPAGGEDPLALARRILKETVAKHGIEEEKLLGRSQWRELTRVRKEAIYRMWKEARAGVSDIGRLFNRTPSAVSQLIRSIELPPSN